MMHVDRIRKILEDFQPCLTPGDDDCQAAVALILHEKPEGLHILFIRRTAREDDPWSGQLAFPGGRMEPRDAEPRETAERETLEELGLDLRSGEYLGRLSDLSAYIHPVKVAGFVYSIAHPGAFVLSSEVASAFWTPVRDLADASRRTTFRVLRGSQKRLVPAIDLFGPGHPVLWGLTYRFTAQLLGLIGIDLPPHEPVKEDL